MHPEALKKWELERGEASGFQTSDIRPGSVTNFALFSLVNGRYVLVSVPGYKWQESAKQEILKGGHSVLYYCTAETLKAEAYQKFIHQPIVDISLPPNEKVLALTEVGAELTRVLYDSIMTQETLILAEEISQQMVTCVQQDVTCVAAIGKLANHHWYTYYHSARVAAYSIALAIKMGESNAKKLEAIAVGCLLHDIGKSKIDLHILNKGEVLTSEEWILMRRHPEMGGEVVEGSGLSTIPIDIILHHHERLDGAGYPHKLNSGEISLEVRMAAFSDVFDALTTNRPFQKSCSRFEALDVIRSRFLNQLDKECFKAMVAILHDTGKVN
jgi:putative nucleotidyltransferase with HDIG domain